MLGLVVNCSASLYCPRLAASYGIYCFEDKRKNRPVFANMPALSAGQRGCLCKITCFVLVVCVCVGLCCVLCMLSCCVPCMVSCCVLCMVSCCALVVSYECCGGALHELCCVVLGGVWCGLVSCGGLGCVV